MGIVRREYYPIGRVAQILGCEAEDILHWGAHGMVEGCVLLSGDKIKASFKRDGKTNWHPDPEKDVYSHPDEFFELNGYSWGAAGQYSVLRRIWEEGALYAEGPWAFSPFVLKDIIAGRPPRFLRDESLWPAGNNKAGDELYMSIRLVGDSDKTIDASQIYLVWDDVERIRVSIESNTPLEILPHFLPLHPRREPVVDGVEPAPLHELVSDLPLTMKDGRAEANKVRHGRTRERRIAAARRVQELRPEQCSNAASWARAVLDLEAQAFSDGEPAGVDEIRLAQVIRDAIKAEDLQYQMC